jgi:hypothetical protein
VNRGSQGDLVFVALHLAVWVLKRPGSVEADGKAECVGLADDTAHERVRTHMLICTLACDLVWHLRKAWAPVTFTDEHPLQQHNPVAAAQRSTHARPKPPQTPTSLATS